MPIFPFYNDHKPNHLQQARPSNPMAKWAPNHYLNGVDVNNFLHIFFTSEKTH